MSEKEETFRGSLVICHRGETKKEKSLCRQRLVCLIFWHLRTYY